MKKAMLVGALLTLSAVAPSVWAQDTLASDTHAVVNAEQPVHLQATVVGIDRAARTMTLKNPNGDVVVVGVSDKLTGFERVKLGDRIDVLYKNALLVSLGKTTGKDQGVRERADSVVATPTADGDGLTVARRSEVIATVQKVDVKKNLVTLRGAYQTMTLTPTRDVDIHSLKVGDTVHAVFESAMALEVSPPAATKVD